MIKQFTNLFFNYYTIILLIIILFVSTSFYFNKIYYEQRQINYICEANGGIVINVIGIKRFCLPVKGIKIV